MDTTYRDPLNDPTLRRGSINYGVVTIPVATLIAVALLPNDASEPGSLLWSAWALTIGLTLGIINDLLTRGITSVLRAQHLVIFAVISVAYGEVLQPWYSSTLSVDVIAKNFIAIGLFGTTVAIGCSGRTRQLPRLLTELATREYSDEVIFRIMLACFGLAMFNFLYASDFSVSVVLEGLRSSRFAAPWARGKLGGWDAFRDFLNNFGYVVPTFTVLLALRRGWRHHSVLIGIICSLVLLTFILQSGSRRLVVVVIGSALVTWFVARRRDIKPTAYIITFALLFVIFVANDFLLAQRKIGFEEITYDVSQFRGVVVDDNFWAMGETIRAIPDEVDYAGFATPWYMIVRPIPRVLWPNKPVDPGFDLAEHLRQNGVSFSITAMGEAYMSFGWVGIAAGGLILGWLSKNWSQFLDFNVGIVATALYGLGVMALFMGIRSYIELIIMTYPIGAWLALDRVFWKWSQPIKLKRRRNNLVQDQQASEP